MSRQYSLLFLALLPLAVLAGPRTRSEAKAIALGQARQLGITTSAQAMQAAPRKAASQHADTAEPYYIFNNGHDRGFTVVAGDNLLPDIVGYTTTGSYDDTTAPPQLASYLQAYGELAEAVARGDRQALRLAAEARALRTSTAYTPVAVSPLLEKEGIRYNQSEPYNNLCPEYATGKRAATGCVATAMAQVMRYHRYPASLQADIASYTTTTHGITIPAISAGQAYDWDNMLPDYADATHTDAQATAVATLMQHCGAAVKMDYSSSSGANVTPIRLSHYFGFDADLIEMVDRNVCTQQQWNTLLDTELQAGRPVLFEGYTSSSGHEFVCDGADGTGLYHINWGWGGYEDGFFDITTLNPKKGGIGSGNAPDGYNRDNGIIIGIAPDNGHADEPLFVQPVAALVYGDYQGLTWTTTERTNATQTFRGQAKYWFANTNTTAFDGYLGLAIAESDGTYRVLASSKAQIDPVERSLSYNSEQASFTTQTLAIDYAFPVGSHRLQTVYSTDGTTWQPCANYNFPPTVIDVTATTLTDATESPLEVSALLPDGDLFTGVADTVSFTFTNTGSSEYAGIVNFYTKLNDDTTPTTDDLAQTIQLFLPAGESVTRTVTVNPGEDGKLYLYIADSRYDNEVVYRGQTDVVANGTPDLTLNSYSTNATEGAYETERAYYSGYQVRMPLAKDDKAVFTASIHNAGEDYKGTLAFVLMDPSDWTYIGLRYVTAVFPAGETTEVAIEVTPEEAGTNTFHSFVTINDKAVTLTMPTTTWRLYTTDGSSYFDMKFNECDVYVDNTASGIASPAAPTPASEPVYTLGGVRLERITQPGIYIQGGRKVVVK